MKKYCFLFIVIGLLFFSCKNDTSQNKSTSPNKEATPSQEAIDRTTSDSQDATSSEAETDFWKKNNCTRSIPEPTANEVQRTEGYSFELDKVLGQGIEKINFDKGDDLTIINKGCESIWLVYTYHLNSTVHPLDLSDEMAVSKKLLSLVQFTTQLSDPPLNIKGRLPMLAQVIDQLGGFEIGQEFLFSSEEIKEAFSLDKVEEKDGKLVMQFSFSIGPL